MIYSMLFLGVVVTAAIVLNLRSSSPAIANEINAWLFIVFWGVMLVTLSTAHVVRYSSDMWLYVGQLHEASRSSFAQFISGADRDIGFSTLVWMIANVGANEAVFRAMLAGVVTCGCLYAALRLFADRRQSFLIFFVSTVSPVFFAYATNTVRQGVAIAMILGAAAAVVAGRHRNSTGRRRIGVTLVLMSAPFMHLSALIPAALIFLASVRMPKVRTVVFVWILGVFLYVTDLNRALMSPVAGLTSRSSAYVDQFANSSSYYSGGVNRLDFLAVSVLMVSSCWLLRQRAIKSDLLVADRLLVILIALNAYFLYFAFLTFSDRIAAYSWFMAPFALGAYALAPSASRFVSIATVVGALCVAVLAGFPLLAAGGPA